MADPNPSVTHSFANSTTADANQVNTNFNDVLSWMQTYAVRRDGAVDFTQPVTGVTPTDDAHLVTKAYSDDGPPALQVSSLALTNTSPTAVGAWEDFDGGYVSFSDPGRAVAVLAFLSSDAGMATDEKHTVLVRPSISFDAGSSYTAGISASAEVIGTGTDDVTDTHLTTFQLRSGTPTGQIRVKAQLRAEQNSPGTPSAVDFTNAHLVVVMFPA